jgi:hypothetical protein
MKRILSKGTADDNSTLDEDPNVEYKQLLYGALLNSFYVYTIEDALYYTVVLQNYQGDPFNGVNLYYNTDREQYAIGVLVATSCDYNKGELANILASRAMAMEKRLSPLEARVLWRYKLMKQAIVQWNTDVIDAARKAPFVKPVYQANVHQFPSRLISVCDY